MSVSSTRPSTAPPSRPSRPPRRPAPAEPGRPGRALHARTVGLVRHVAGAQGHHDRHPPQQDHRPDRPVGLRQEHAAPLLQPDERPDRRARGWRARSASTATASPAPTSTPSRCAGGSAWSSRSRTRSPRASTKRRLGRADQRLPGRHGRAGRALAPPRRALGRGQEQAPPLGPRPLRRPAAAALHRPDPGRRARGHPDGRALLGPRPDLDGAGRGPDGRPQGRVHDRHRHPQHAAGPPRQRHDRLPDARRGRARTATAPASSPSSAPPTSSSPTPRTRGPKPTSPGGSGRIRGGSVRGTYNGPCSISERVAPPSQRGYAGRDKASCPFRRSFGSWPLPLLAFR